MAKHGPAWFRPGGTVVFTDWPEGHPCHPAKAQFYATTKLMQLMLLKCPATSGPGFVVPRLPAPLPRVVCWPGPAVTWLCSDLSGAESQRETNPRRQGDLLPAGSASILEDLGLIWRPAPRRREDMSNSWRWRWGGGPLIFMMVWLMCEVRLCSKATQVHPWHLLTSEEDPSVMGKIFQARSSRRVENNWSRWCLPVLSSLTWHASVVTEEKIRQQKDHESRGKDKLWQCHIKYGNV